MHGTTFRAIKVTSCVATRGMESAVYDCLVVFVRLRSTPALFTYVVRRWHRRR